MWTLLPYYIIGIIFFLSFFFFFAVFFIFVYNYTHLLFDKPIGYKLHSQLDVLNHTTLTSEYLSLPTYYYNYPYLPNCGT
jgi:hypothetical protein